MFTFESPFALRQEVFFRSVATKYFGGQCWLESQGQLKKIDNYDGYLANEPVIVRGIISEVSFLDPSMPLFKVLISGSTSSIDLPSSRIYDSESQAKKELEKDLRSQKNKTN